MTTREIGAYLCGARLRRLYNARGAAYRLGLRPTDLEVLNRLVGEDAELAASMDESQWWRQFWAGWEERAG